MPLAEDLPLGTRYDALEGGEKAELYAKWKTAFGRWCLRGSSVVLCVPIVIIPFEIMGTGRNTYLSATGLFAMVLFVVMLQFFFDSASLALEESVEREDRVRDLRFDDDGEDMDDDVVLLPRMRGQSDFQAGVTKRALHRVFGRYFSKMRVLKFAMVVSGALVNLYGFTSAVAHLPTRDPTVTLNMATHVTVWAEFLGELTCLIFFVPILVRFATQEEGDMPGDLVTDVCLYGRDLCSFSLLRLTCEAKRSLAEIAEVLYDNDVTPSERLRLVLELLNFMTVVPLGVLAFMVKVGSVGFVTEISFWEWGLSQWMALMLLFNNMMSMNELNKGVSEGAVRMFEYSGLLAEDPDHWRHAFQMGLVQTYGRVGTLCVLQTMSNDEAAHVFNKQDQSDSDSLDEVFREEEHVRRVEYRIRKARREGAHPLGTPNLGQNTPKLGNVKGNSKGSMKPGIMKPKGKFAGVFKMLKAMKR